MSPSESVPRWAEPLLDAESMRAIDAWSIERAGVPSLELMELAGTAVARAALEPSPEGPIVVVCGKGNNGGDGLVAARLLREAEDRLGDKAVEVVLLDDPAELSEDARPNFDRLPGGPPRTYDVELISEAGVLIDAMLGTGAGGEPRGLYGDAVSAINARAAVARVIAVDIPTGVDASTGEAPGDAVHADLTIALHAPKVGHYVAPGAFYCGELRIADIGIPPEAAAGAAVRASAGTVTPRVLRMIPGRHDVSSKFSSGVLAVLGGSTGLTGATCLSALAAQRTGAGYVTVMVPESLNVIFEQRLLEVMSQPLPDAAGSLIVEGLDAALARCERSDAVIVGPGIGRTEGTIELVRGFVGGCDKPLLVDADGLFAFAGRIESIARDAPTVITPHAGELAGLLATDTDSIEARRLEHARTAAELSGAVVVLKGADTIIAVPGEPPLVNILRAPGLATAGTGDVLAGVIGSLLAKGLPAREAAAAGVLAHALAGREASERRGVNHVIASDVIDALPAVLG